jgi:adenylate kinase
MEPLKIHRLIIFGPCGVGKGTQAELIAQKLNLKHFSTGEILRKAVADGTDLGKQAQAIMNTGALVSDDIMIGIVKEAISNPDSANNFILDGFPRTLAQAEALDKIFAELGYDNINIISLTANEEELVNRLLKRGRSDDSEETVKHRIHVYNESTAPILAHYDGQYNIIEINGVGEIEDISAKILKYVA